MKSVVCDLPREITEIEVHTISDVHLGDKHCNLKLVRERIEHIKNTPNAFCILNGDLINNGTKTSVSDIYSEVLSPMEQIQGCIDLFEPIKDKILAITSGNHCLRSYKNDGIDIMRIVSAQLEIQDKYGSDGVLLFVRFGKEPKGRKTSKGEARKLCYTIYCTHGSGGGGTAGAKANSLHKLGRIINADVCIVGHTHFPLCFKENSFVIDYANSTFREKETVFVNAGSTLGWGGYSERMSLQPSSNANPVVLLNGCKFGIEIKI